MITNWRENQYGNWRGFIIFLDDIEIDEEDKKEMGWYEFIYSYFF